MNQIQFGSYRSYDDFNLILESKEIGSPAIKTKEVAVEGSSTTIDYTEYFGRVKYGKRKLSFLFNTIMPQAEFLTLYSTICNALQGQKMKIVLDEDSDYYYLGRLTVSAFTSEKGIGTITIDCDCEPWKYKKDITTVSASVNYDLASGGGTQTAVLLANSRKEVVPEITTTAPVKIEFGGYTTNIGEGTFTIPTLELVEGVNVATVTATSTKSGTITFRYQEGGL